MDYKKIIKENLEKLEQIKEEKSKIYKILQDAQDIRHSGTIGEYTKKYNEIIKPNEEKQKILNIKKAIIYNNFAAICQDLFINDFLPQLAQFKNKNIGEKTRDKINGIFENILQAQGLKIRSYYNLSSYIQSNVLHFNFLLLDSQGYTHGNDSEFYDMRLEIPTGSHLFDKIEEATTYTSDRLQLVKIEEIDNTAAHLQIQHNLLEEEINQTIKKLAEKRTDYQNLLVKNLHNIKSLEIDYKVNLY